MSEITLIELKKIFASAGLEYYVKKCKDGIVKVHFLVKKEYNES